METIKIKKLESDFMSQHKDWEVLLEKEENSKVTHISASKRKKRIPVYARITISLIVYCIAYTLLNIGFPSLASYINALLGIVLATTGFIITSYRDYKNKLYNEIFKEDI